jgi:hypothetical protein
MGYTLGPILNAYLALPNGGQVVMTAMGAVDSNECYRLRSIDMQPLFS